MAEPVTDIDLAARIHVESEEPRTATVLSFAEARAQFVLPSEEPFRD